MNDEELLTKYKNYVKKRNIIVVISLLFLCFMSLAFFYSISKKNEIPGNQSSNEPEVEQKEEIIDDESPILELTTDKIIIEINKDINYTEYIKEATDDIDGDLIDKVQYSKIDTSVVGEYEILYFVFDSSNNMAQKLLNVVIVEPSKEEIPEQKEEPNNNAPSNKPSTSNNENKKEENKPSTPQTKYFLFTDGYTMSNVVEACASELRKYNGAGICSPITDDKGIYLGMKLELK